MLQPPAKIPVTGHFPAIITLIPLGKYLIDKTIARHQFPLPANFETLFGQKHH